MKYAYFRKCRPNVGSTQSPVQCVSGAFTLGVKCPVREAHHLPQSNAEVKNKHSYRIISSTNFNAQFSLFINNMFVTLLSSTCFEH